MINKDVEELKEKTYSDLIARNKHKYFWFIQGLKSVKHVSKNRGEFLEHYYAYMRYVDDIVDGDRPLPKEYSTAEEFVNERINYLKSGTKSKETIDNLLSYSFEIAKQFEEDFVKETDDILKSMLFDAKRYNSGQVFSERELGEHFFLLDIRGTIRGTLKIFNENPDNYIYLKPIGSASRIYYNLRDYDEDISSGLVNIPKEDFQKFSLTINSMVDKSDSRICEWKKSQAELGIQYINEHHTLLKNAELGMPALLTLKIVYEKPAKNYFKKILKNSQNNHLYK